MHIFLKKHSLCFYIIVMNKNAQRLRVEPFKFERLNLNLFWFYISGEDYISKEIFALLSNTREKSMRWRRKRDEARNITLVNFPWEFVKRWQNGKRYITGNEILSISAWNTLNEDLFVRRKLIKSMLLLWEKTKVGYFLRYSFTFFSLKSFSFDEKGQLRITIIKLSFIIIKFSLLLHFHYY